MAQRTEASSEMSLHFGFCCIAIVQAERERLDKVRQLAALPGVKDRTTDADR